MLIANGMDEDNAIASAADKFGMSIGAIRDLL